jgi:UDP-hydrolysing UDP-N-acetyl-D-glucosamine 2-epimerase
MNRSRICVVTGSRAEYGLLRPVMRGLREDPGFELQVIATGGHLSPAFGATVETIEADGFTVDERVEMLLASDSVVGITSSLGIGTIGFGGALGRLRPDLVLLLGDRFEILAAVQAALLARVPVAHLSGGDVTEGAYDDAIRHAITKLSHLHFVTNADAARRVRQMGEDPRRVLVAGNPGIDDLVRFEPLPRVALEEALGLRLRRHNLLVTYHPATLADEPPAAAFGELLAALDGLGHDVGLILTLPNPDVAGTVVASMARDFASKRINAVVHGSLGQTRYWSCLHTVDVVVGNSSSGLSEAPAVGLPSVNIGERQRGRLRPASTIDCAADRDAITAALDRALHWTDVPVGSPYGDGHATERILTALRAVDDWPALLHKRFHDV